MYETPALTLPEQVRRTEEHQDVVALHDAHGVQIAEHIGAGDLSLRVNAGIVVSIRT